MDLAVPTGEMQRIGPIVAARAEVAWFKGAIGDMADEIRAAYDQAQKQSDPWMQGELAFWLWRCDGALERIGCIADPFAHQIAGNWAEAASLWESIGAPYEMALALADSPNEADLRKALELMPEAAWDDLRRDKRGARLGMQSAVACLEQRAPRPARNLWTQ